MKIQEGKVLQFGSQQVAKLPSETEPSRVHFKQVHNLLYTTQSTSTHTYTLCMYTQHERCPINPYCPCELPVCCQLTLLHDSHSWRGCQMSWRGLMWPCLSVWRDWVSQEGGCTSCGRCWSPGAWLCLPPPPPHNTGTAPRWKPSLESGENTLCRSLVLVAPYSSWS